MSVICRLGKKWLPDFGIQLLIQLSIHDLDHVGCWVYILWVDAGRKAGSFGNLFVWLFDSYEIFGHFNGPSFEGMYMPGGALLYSGSSSACARLPVFTYSEKENFLLSLIPVNGLKIVWAYDYKKNIRGSSCGKRLKITRYIGRGNTIPVR